MAKNVKKSLLWSRLVPPLTFAVLIVILVVGQIPIERMRYSGGCISKDKRLSLVLDGPEKIIKAREEVNKMNLDRQERHKKYPALMVGCDLGLSYAVYIF